jgi:capsular polysaccharide biosynthesis protein
MELRRYLRLLRRRLSIIIVTVIVGGAVAFFTTSGTPTYTATSQIYVGPINLGANSAQLYAEAGLNQVVATFAQMIPSAVIAQKAIDKTGINRYSGEVAASTVATVIPSTNLINVSVTDSTSAGAIGLTNGVAKAFVSQISQYQGPTTGAKEGAVPNEPAYVFQTAISSTQISSDLTKKVLLGALFGLVISILLIFLLDYLDVTIRSPEELEDRVGLPVLGIIPRLSSLELSDSPGGSLPRPVVGGSLG